MKKLLLLSALLIFACSSDDDNNIAGCTDSGAVNYNPSASQSDAEMGNAVDTKSVEVDVDLDESKWEDVTCCDVEVVYVCTPEGERERESV